MAGKRWYQFGWPFGPATEQKESATGGVISMNSVGRPKWMDRNLENFAREGYIQNAIAYRCISLIAEAASLIPFLVFEGDKEMEQHPLLTVFTKPNPFQGGTELWRAWYSFAKIAGNSYLEPVILDGNVRELFVLRPDRMKVVPGRRGYPAAYEYTVGANMVRFDMQDLPSRQQPILHFKEFHPIDDWYGLSPIEAAAFAIDVHNQAGAFNKALLDNGARPSGALVYEPKDKEASRTLPDDQFMRLKKELDEKYSGAKNAGRPMLLEGGLSWQQMGLTSKDMEFMEAKREAAREIALAFGVPPMILGIPGDNTYANYKEANRAFYRQTVLPLVERTCQALTNFFTPTFGDKLRVDYDEDQVVGLIAEREELWDKVTAADHISVDEKREATGYAPYEPNADSPGDVILVPSSKIPLEEAMFQPGGAEPIGDPNAQPAPVVQNPA